VVATSEAIETFEEDLEEGRNHNNAEDQHACDNVGLAVLLQGNSRFESHILRIVTIIQASASCLITPAGYEMGVNNLGKVAYQWVQDAGARLDTDIDLAWR
jgi:hypothetical protein